MTTTYFSEQALAATATMAQQEPLIAHTREAVLGVERILHERGWDKPAEVVQFDRRGDEVFAGLNAPLTACLHLANLRGYHNSVALAGMADSAEHSRALMTALGVDGPGEVDLVGSLVPGFEFYGFGLVSESWAANLRTSTPDLGGAVLRGELSEHPDRVEARVVTLTCRDGLVWMCLRPHGGKPEIVGLRPEGDYEFMGSIVHGLARMTAAVITNSMPIPQLAGDHDMVGVHWRDT